MATIDDLGGANQPLNAPPLGGPTGWAAAVRDALKAVQANVLTNTNDIAALGTWQDYTPTFTGTGFVLGASTVEGEYCLIGETCHFRASLTLGAGFALPSGSMGCSLPHRNGGVRSGDIAHFNNAGTNLYRGSWYVSPSGYSAAIVPVDWDNNAANMNFNNGTNPFAWDVSDSIDLAGSYRIA
jgi:hypothetical protein